MFFEDQLNRTIELPQTPKRIVSLVPSQTELLYDLGLDETVVGITKFCIHPNEWFRTKARVGGTKKVNIEKVAALKPDLIIANKEENLKEDIEALESIAPVWISDIKTLEDALQMIENIGEIVNQKNEAISIVNAIKTEFEKLSRNAQKTCCYLIWQNPYMTIGADTFINNMLKYCGFKNMFADKERYPMITIDDIKIAAPEFLLLSSEPFPFKQKQLDEFQQLLPHTKVMLVDGEMFSWYGSRLLKAVDYFRELFNLL